MNRLEASDIAEDISKIAGVYLIQLGKHKVNLTIVNKYFIGILRREKIILHDISEILRNNDDSQITSSFILFRVLLDDFIRLFCVYASNDRENEIINICSDAHRHQFKSIEEMYKINVDFFEGKHPNLYTKEIVDNQKQQFASDKENEMFFLDKKEFRFKKLTPISDVFKLMSKNVKTKSNIDSYLIYKHLTQYVHFSNIAFSYDWNLTARKYEIDQIEHILIFCYKSLLMINDFFATTYAITLNDSKARLWFDSIMNKKE